METVLLLSIYSMYLLSRILLSPRPVRIAEVDVVQSEFLCVACTPLQVVHQRPGSVTLHITAIDFDC